jgi:hypothetical protein
LHFRHPLLGCRAFFGKRRSFLDRALLDLLPLQLSLR